jgi:hypothetical protein
MEVDSRIRCYLPLMPTLPVKIGSMAIAREVTFAVSLALRTPSLADVSRPGAADFTRQLD